MEMSSVPRRTYACRKGVDWYDPQSMDAPLHGQKHSRTKKYWNAFLGKWCSKKSRRADATADGRITTLQWPDLPECFSPNTLGRIRAERVRLFLSLVYRLHLIRHGNGHVKVLYVDNNTMKAFLGYRWQELVNALESEGVIRTRRAPSKYDAGKKCLYVSLSPGYRPSNQAPVQTAHLEDAALERTIERNYQRSILEGDPLLDAVRRTLDRTVLTVTPSQGADAETLAWLHFLSTIATTEHPTERNFLYGIRRNAFTRRIDHIFTPLPRSWQGGFQIAGEPARRIGIRNSLAGLLYLCCRKNGKGTGGKLPGHPPSSFLNRFSISNQAGMEIFDYMTLRLEGRGSLGKPGKYEEMRTLFLRMLFGPPKGMFKGREVSEHIRLIFGDDMLDYLHNVRKVSEGKPESFFHRNLSSILQREEAEILEDVMTRLHGKGIPFISMHDALIVPERHVSKVRDAFKAEIERRGWGDMLQVP